MFPYTRSGNVVQCSKTPSSLVTQTYGSAEEANNAIAAMDGQNLDGRQVRVNLANQRTGGGC